MGALLVAATVLVAAWRRSDAREVTALTRFGLLTLLVGVLPAYVLMRVGAEWIASKEGFGDNDPDWIGVGYTTADLGAILILVSLVLGGIGLRQLRRGARERLVIGRIVGAITLILLAGYAVAVWAMSATPGG